MINLFFVATFVLSVLYEHLECISFNLVPQKIKIISFKFSIRSVQQREKAWESCLSYIYNFEIKFSKYVDEVIKCIIIIFNLFVF